MERYGWQLYAHPLFLDQIERLLASVERARRSDPEEWRGKADARLLAALKSLILDRIPRAPLSPDFRQGNTLGKDRRHWFRAKFGGNRFRLFFRADSQARVIVYAWVNDRDTLRKAGAGTDPYAVFARMLANGNPPDDWPALLVGSRDNLSEALTQFDGIFGLPPGGSDKPTNLACNAGVR
ncbi:type II toxin-antitoxin system YhaV family toxin (plasmid) [Acidiphilium acidophilum]|nr:type II toxin-antitoxin system YhaV family toxin [Acidiphilium acidophilum]